MKIIHFITACLILITAPSYAVVQTMKSSTIVQHSINQTQNIRKVKITKIKSKLCSLQNKRYSGDHGGIKNFFYILAVIALIVALFSLVIYFLPAATTPILTLPFKVALLDSAFWGGVSLLCFLVALIID